MAQKIDPVAGYEMRKDRMTEVSVYMKIGEPGVYYDRNGNKLSKAIAERAGFDVEGQTKEKARQDRLAQFTAKLDADMERATEKRKIVAEQGNYVLVDAGLGRVFVEDISGARAVPHPIPLAAGKQFLKDFAAEEGEAKDGGAKA